MASTQFHDQIDQHSSPRLNCGSSETRLSDDVGQSSSKDASTSATNRRLRAFSLGRQAQTPKHVRLSPVKLPNSKLTGVYKGSFSDVPRRSIASSRGSVDSPGASVQTFFNPVQSGNLTTGLHMNLGMYDLEELRLGFFDATFSKPPKPKYHNSGGDTEKKITTVFQRGCFTVYNAFSNQWRVTQNLIKDIASTRAGIKLTKSFLAPFIAYVLCLVPLIGSWLGRYSYIMVISTIINHPGRPLGAQLDGAIATILGTAAGLGWGALALCVSDSTASSRRGYGGILAVFLIMFMAPLSALRAFYIRLYQLVICAGIAILYTCLVEASEEVAWSKLLDYGLPWALGQGLCLLICSAIFPDAGARPLAVALHNAFDIMQHSLDLLRAGDAHMHQKLALTFVNLSEARRDLVIDFSLTRFPPSDITELRNLMQAVIRSFLALKMDVYNYEEVQAGTRSVHDSKAPSSTKQDVPKSEHIPDSGNPNVTVSAADESPNSHGDVVIDIDSKERARSSPYLKHNPEVVTRLVLDKIYRPASDLAMLMRSSLQRCDAVIMSMSGYRKYLGPPANVSTDILGILGQMRKAMVLYDAEEEALLQSSNLPSVYADKSDFVMMLLFSRPIRQASTSLEKLLIKVAALQQKRRGWKLYLPSYPLHKALQRTNAQVRHDRGGLTAAHLFRSQKELARSLTGLATVDQPLRWAMEDPLMEHKSTAFDQTSGSRDSRGLRSEVNLNAFVGKKKDFTVSKSKVLTLHIGRLKLWNALHQLQGFETRFALKVAITVALLSIPAWLEESKTWWNRNEVWWAVVFAWLMLHPRVGGNVQDLITRVTCALLGAIWGGVAYGAHDGNPYVMALLAAVFMFPMMHRFTQSSHPRSGMTGCISFVVVSLSSKSANGLPSVTQIAWTRGLSFVVGIASAVIINWMLWPFVARHELRKALSAMMIYCSDMYRSVVANYVYFEEGHEPDENVIRHSEMLEGRLREGFVRIRQLMALTSHEIRLRGPIPALPYHGIITSLESFFEYLVEIRQSSLFFHPHYLSDNKQAAEILLTYRRDAVAAVLMNLYVLAGGLRLGRKIPRYLPNAAAARKRLLDHMSLLESEGISSSAKDTLDPHPKPQPGPEIQNQDGDASNTKDKGIEQISSEKKWSEIYSYSYSQSLTGCVQQLEELQKYTKAICGEQGFDNYEFHSPWDH